MLELVEHRALYALRSAWENMEVEGAYQSFFINKLLYERMIVYSLQRKYTPYYYEIREEGKTVLIVPLCRYWKTKTFCSLGNVNGFQVYDFVYDKATQYTELKSYVEFFLRELRWTGIELSHMPPQSMAYRCLCELLSDKKSISEYENVAISLEKGYLTWYESLSKNSRQNIRTAYNRLEKAELAVRLDIYRGQRISRRMLNKLLEIYFERHESRYAVRTSLAKRLYLKYFDFSTAYQQDYRNNMYAVLFINNEIAGFMSGVVERDNASFIVPRLSIVSKFAKYSPGVMLINEFAKQAESQGIRTLDLSKGNERYKTVMGGEIYYTYTLKAIRGRYE